MKNKNLQEEKFTGLNLCPFCGGEAEYFEFEDFDGDYVEDMICVKCTICEARSASVDVKNKAAVKKIMWLWNMRS